MEYRLVGFHMVADDFRYDLLLAFIFFLLKIKEKLSNRYTKNIN